MSSNLFITGNSSGLGRGLTETYLSREWTVYGLSRRGCSGFDGRLHDIRCDLEDREAIPLALSSLLEDVSHLDLVILNAGILGQMKDLSDTTLDEIEQVMEINVWSNKLILDWLLSSDISIEQIVLISSGASVNGNRGWGAYGISKAALNMLTSLYAHELPNTHLSALAPGLVDTTMQDYLCNMVDAEKFTSVKKLRAARDTTAMPDPKTAGELIADTIPRLCSLPSGAYADIRSMQSD